MSSNFLNLRFIFNYATILLRYLICCQFYFTERPYLGLRMRFPISPQIVGGSDAPEGSCSQIVSLQWGTSRTSHFCAGSIYNNKWIITAAHCILAVPENGRFIVKAGKHNLNSVETGEQEREVKNCIVHEKYQRLVIYIYIYIYMYILRTSNSFKLFKFQNINIYKRYIYTSIILYIINLWNEFKNVITITNSLKKLLL